MIDMPIPVRAIEGDAQGQLRAGLSQAALIVLAQEVILHLARWSERHAHAADAAPCPAEIQGLADALVSRDPDEARRIVFHARAQGAGHESLCRDHIATAARRLGVMWEDDDVTFSDMAIAAGRILSILRELREMAPPFEPRGGRCALIATVPGELHSIGATMAADMLRNKGWDVDLRMGQSETDLARTLRGGGYPIVGLSASTPERIRALARAGFDLDSLSFACRTAEGHRAEFARHAAPAAPPEAGPETEVQVIGPFARASGLGQATRLSARMLDQAGFAVHRVEFALDNPSPGAPGEARAAWRPARVNLWHLNIEALPLAAAYLPDVFSGSTNIAYPFWELDSPAACHFLGLTMVDELWMAAPFGVESFAPHCACPVHEVGMSFEPLPEIPRDAARAFLRARTGAGPEDFTFLVSFDSFSFLGRKNPQGVLAAFERAFPRDAPETPPVRLLIKTQNRARVADPAQAGMWQAVDAALARDPRITLLDATLPYDEVLRLKAGADAYVSLHRAEGWGFGMIEAMNLGVPVLATGYSANMAFCSPETCWLVDYRLTEVGPDDYIFVRPGQHWAEPDIAHAAAQMRALHDDPVERAARAGRAQARIRRDFSPTAVGARYAARLRPLLAGGLAPRTGD